MGIVALSTDASASVVPYWAPMSRLGLFLILSCLRLKLKAGTQLSSASSRLFINNDRDT